MSALDDIGQAEATLARVVRLLRHRDLRVACPRPCPEKKANKGRKAGAKHVCELVPGDLMTPMERMRNASPAQMQAQRYDRAGGRSSTTSDPTGRVGQQLVKAGPGDEEKLRALFAAASRHLGLARLLSRDGIPAKRTDERRALDREAKEAWNAARQCDLIVMRWGPPRPPTQSDRRQLAKCNVVGPPDCQCCGDPVLLVGFGALETNAAGNLPNAGPTCDWCVRIARRTGAAPTRRMLTDRKAGRQVRILAPNHVEAS